jgi:hypothetical protein
MSITTKAGQLELDRPGFKVMLEKDQAKISMTLHHATAEDARAEVEPFLR